MLSVPSSQNPTAPGRAPVILPYCSGPLCTSSVLTRPPPSGIPVFSRGLFLGWPFVSSQSLEYIFIWARLPLRHRHFRSNSRPGLPHREPQTGINHVTTVALLFGSRSQPHWGFLESSKVSRGRLVCHCPNGPEESCDQTHACTPRGGPAPAVPCRAPFSRGVSAKLRAPSGTPVFPLSGQRGVGIVVSLHLSGESAGGQTP